jgi:hypothetical protein
VPIHLEGGRAKIKGIHFAAANAIAEYIAFAGIESGPFFRPRRLSHSEQLAIRRLSQRAMYAILIEYLSQLPGAITGNDLAVWREEAGVCRFAALTRSWQGRVTNRIIAL